MENEVSCIQNRLCHLLTEFKQVGKIFLLSDLLIYKTAVILVLYLRVVISHE
jgi:hypothetical protein